MAKFKRLGIDWLYEEEQDYVKSKQFKDWSDAHPVETTQPIKTTQPKQGLYSKLVSRFKVGAPELGKFLGQTARTAFTELIQPGRAISAEKEYQPEPVSQLEQKRQQLMKEAAGQSFITGQKIEPSIGTKAGEFVGAILPRIAPQTAAIRGIGAVSEAPTTKQKLAAGGGAALDIVLAKGLSKTKPKNLKELIKIRKIAPNLTIGGAYGALGAIERGETDTKKILKEAGYGAALMGAADIGLGSLGSFLTKSKGKPSIVMPETPTKRTITDILTKSKAKNIENKTNNITGFLEASPDIKIQKFKTLGTDITGNKIASRMEWNPKTNTGTIYVTSQTTEDNLAHEVGHYVNKKLTFDERKNILGEVSDLSSKYSESERIAEATAKLIKDPSLANKYPRLSDVLKINTGIELKPEVKPTVSGVSKPKTVIERIQEEVQPKKSAISAGGKVLTYEAPTTPSYNPAKLNTSDDVERLIKDTAESYKDEIGKQRRGTISHEQLEELSYMSGVTPSQLEKTKPGAITNAENYRASVRTLQDSAQDLLDYSKSLGDNPTLEQLTELKNKHARYVAIQKTVAGLRTEGGRLLESMKQPVLPGENDILNDLKNNLNKIDPNLGDSIEVIGKVNKALEPDKYGNMLSQIINLPKALIATADMSAALRQGLPMLGKKEWSNAFIKMFSYFGKEEAYQKLFKDMSSHPNYNLAIDSKLGLTGVGVKEEQFVSQLLSKYVPVTRASERAYTGFLNKLRFDVFNDMVEKYKTLGVDFEKNPEIAKNISSFINNFTGRGDIGKLERYSPILTNLSFSPRLVAARFNVLNPVKYIQMDPITRKESLKTLATSAGILTGALTLMKAAGADIPTDPRSSDFGKVKVGNTRVDLLGGYQQIIKTLAQLATGQVVSSTTGKVSEVGVGYKPVTRYEILARYFESKQSPSVSFAVDLLKGQDFKGDPINVTNEIKNLFIPIMAQDIYDLYKEGGLENTALAVPAFFGVGIQTYGGKEDSKKTLQRFLKIEPTEEVTDEFYRLSQTGNSPALSDLTQNERVMKFKQQKGKEETNNLIDKVRENYNKKVNEEILKSSYQSKSDESKKDALDNIKSNILDEILKSKGYKK